MKSINLTGKRFNKLLVLGRAFNQGKKVMWECKCDCGNIIYVSTCNLNGMKSQSCGCYKKQRTIERNTKHNLSKHPLYKIWCAMKKRCFNSKDLSYKTYGAKGISVCEEWKNDFQSFYDWSMSNGYSKSLSIDRIDNNGNYCPENCRWADKKTQANNTSTNRFITFNNETKTLAEWARYYNLSYSCLSSRLSKNWSLERALLTPTKIPKI